MVQKLKTFVVCFINKPRLYTEKLTCSHYLVNFEVKNNRLVSFLKKQLHIISIPILNKIFNLKNKKKNVGIELTVYFTNGMEVFKLFFLNIIR